MNAPALSLRPSTAYNRRSYRRDRDEWWRLPVGEPYIWDYVVQHLCGAGERRVALPPSPTLRIWCSGSPQAALTLPRTTSPAPPSRWPPMSESCGGTAGSLATPTGYVSGSCQLLTVLPGALQP